MYEVCYDCRGTAYDESAWGGLPARPPVGLPLPWRAGSPPHAEGVRLLPWLAVALLASLAGVWAQNGPHLGYVYPAGGRQGTSFHVTVGGQLLSDPQFVDISGADVTASVVQYLRPLSDKEMGETAQFFRDMVRRRWNAALIEQARAHPETVPLLPDHPWLQDLDQKSPAELDRLRLRLFNPKKQPNSQLGEQVEIAVNIAPDAPPGDRELRLVTPSGLSNPLRFQVGTLPELRAEQVGSSGDLGMAAVDTPVVLNGQILPGAVERYRLRAHQGQKLLIRCQARALIPYLADAVPGWFQARLTLYDPQGQELASADNYRFDPDPVLLVTVPADGVYGLEMRDVIYRGREDFVYRITVGELPFITDIYPLGAPAGAPATATVSGWNLPATTVTLDTTPGGAPIRRVGLGAGAQVSNTVPYAVDTLPEIAAARPAGGGAQAVSFPQIVNGRVAHPGEVEAFDFPGVKGDEIVAEVWARRLDSPLDAAIKLVDAKGTQLAANDDHDDAEFGLLTHQADPYVRVKLPADGTYRVYLMDAQGQGGAEYAYRLVLRPAQPDFALRVSPSSLSMVSGRAATATVRIIRKDGWDGAVDLALADAPAGFTLGQAQIASGQDSVQVVLSPPRGAPPQLVPVRLEGHAQVGGTLVTRPALAAEYEMQAFAYWHLVPMPELLVAVTAPRPMSLVWRPLVEGMTLADAGPLEIPQGGTAQVVVTARPILPDRLQTPLGAVRFTLPQPPRGVRLQGVRMTPTGVALIFKADANSTQVGATGNLLVAADVRVEGAHPAGLAGLGTERVSLGVLPAIPIRIAPGS